LITKPSHSRRRCPRQSSFFEDEACIAVRKMMRQENPLLPVALCSQSSSGRPPGVCASLGPMPMYALLHSVIGQVLHSLRYWRAGVSWCGLYSTSIIRLGRGYCRHIMYSFRNSAWRPSRRYTLIPRKAPDIHHFSSLDLRGQALLCYSRVSTDSL
jgi:hypothetical protein